MFFGKLQNQRPALWTPSINLNILVKLCTPGSFPNIDPQVTTNVLPFGVVVIFYAARAKKHILNALAIGRINSARCYHHFHT